MFQKLKNNKTKVIIGLFLLSILSIVYLVYSSKKPQSLPSGITPPLPALSTPSPLQIISSYPASGKFVLNFPLTALTFQFNQPVNINQIRIDISPQTKVVLSLSPDKYSVYARPENPWLFNKEYKITVTGPFGVTLAENTITFLDPLKNPTENDYGDPPEPGYQP